MRTHRICLALATVVGSLAAGPSPVAGQADGLKITPQTKDGKIESTTVEVQGVKVTVRGVVQSVSSEPGRTVLAAGSEPGETEVVVEGHSSKFGDAIRQVTIDARAVTLITSDGRSLVVNRAATPAAPSPKTPEVAAGPTGDRVLSSEEQRFIREELTRMREGASVSEPLLGQLLRDRAEELAMKYLKVAERDAIPAAIRLDLGRLAEELALSPPSPGRGSTRRLDREPWRDSDWRRRDSDWRRRESDYRDDYEPRCECIYCHPLHEPGTCPYPYCPPTVPWRYAVPVLAPAVVQTSGHGGKGCCLFHHPGR